MKLQNIRFVFFVLVKYLQLLWTVQCPRIKFTASQGFWYKEQKERKKKKAHPNHKSAINTCCLFLVSGFVGSRNTDSLQDDDPRPGKQKKKYNEQSSETQVTPVSCKNLHSFIQVLGKTRVLKFYLFTCSTVEKVKIQTFLWRSTEGHKFWTFRTNGNKGWRFGSCFRSVVPRTGGRREPTQPEPIEVDPWSSSRLVPGTTSLVSSLKTVPRRPPTTAMAYSL